MAQLLICLLLFFSNPGRDYIEHHNQQVVRTWAELSQAIDDYLAERDVLRVGDEQAREKALRRLKAKAKAFREANEESARRAKKLEEQIRLLR